MNREIIYQEIERERLRQDEKWGLQDHTPIEWIAILGEEFGEASKEALEMHFHPDAHFAQRVVDLRKELFQVAAVSVAIIETLERGTWIGNLFHQIKVYKEQSNDKD